MKKMIFALILTVLIASNVLAAQVSIVGGIRSAFALGVQAEQKVGNGFLVRAGVEGSTGYNPIIAYAGGKFLLTYVGYSSPLYLGLGGVGYFGNSSDMGLSLSCIIDRFLDSKPLSLEFGADFAGTARLMLQLGVKI
jgi:hypothetical protein